MLHCEIQVVVNSNSYCSLGLDFVFVLNMVSLGLGLALIKGVLTPSNVGVGIARCQMIQFNAIN